MRFLFVMHDLVWPRQSGHDVHGYSMMRALAEGGHEISLATVRELSTEAIAGVPLRWRGTLDLYRDISEASPWSSLTERFRSYWGVEPRRIAAVGQLARELTTNIVVAVGLDVLPYLGAVAEAQRVWYAGDEWIWHHLSQWQLGKRSNWDHGREAILKGLYERAFAKHMDRVWVVSKSDQLAMQWAVGHDRIDVVPNGVDTEHYQPIVTEELPRSCVFWGRLDFGPNLQAVTWFLRRVWPMVRIAVPDARFTIYGFRPTIEALTWSGHDGVEVVADLPDLRGEIARHQVVVLPFVSGGGIKNKLLEAASMGRAIIGSRHACNGLDPGAAFALVRANHRNAWVQTLCNLWDDDVKRRDLGARARRWVLGGHTWSSAASVVTAGLATKYREIPPARKSPIAPLS